MIPPITYPNEQAVLAAFVDSSTGLAEASQLLTPEDFSEPTMRCGWEWITGLLLKNRPVSMFSLQQTWGHHEEFPQFKAALSGVQSLLGEGLFYATVLKDRAKLRKAFITLERAVEVAGKSDTFEDARPALESALMATFEDSSAGQDCQLAEAVKGMLEQLRNPAAAPRVFPTGFSKFDVMFTRTKAPPEGSMIIVAGKSGEGKSSVALNIIQTAALAEIPCKVYSMEMDRGDLAIRAGLFFARDASSFDAAMGKAAALPVWLSDRPDRTIESIRSDIRLSAMRHGVKIVIVDYLQLLGSTATKGNENRERQVAHMSRMLKVAAMESKVLVYALSQLNDEGKLRESRAIEQDADAVVYVVAKGGSHYLWVSKNRRGPKHGEVKDIPNLLEKQGIRLDFDSQNYRFHQH